jgi:hypothetical protein
MQRRIADRAMTGAQTVRDVLMFVASIEAAQGSIEEHLLEQRRTERREYHQSHPFHRD